MAWGALLSIASQVLGKKENEKEENKNKLKQAIFKDNEKTGGWADAMNRRY